MIAIAQTIRSSMPFSALRQAIYFLIVIATSVASNSDSAIAQKLNKGDAVEVYFKGKVYPAEVIEPNDRGAVLVEFEYWNKLVLERIRRIDVRLPFEAGAIGKTRKWSSSDGNFKLRAALIEFDQQTITLRKPNMSELTVPISKLSTGDQKYVERLRKLKQKAVDSGDIPPETAERLPLDHFGSADDDSFAISFSGTEEQPTLKLDALTDSVKQLKEAGVGFGKGRKDNSLNAVLAVGGPKKLLLVGGSEDTWHSKSDWPSQLLWVSLDEQRVLERATLAAHEVVLDYDPASERLLTYAEFKESLTDNKETSSLTVWNLPVGGKEVNAIARWQVEPDGWAEPWGRVLDADHVIFQKTRSKYVTWNLAEQKIVYTFNQESWHHAPIKLSPNRGFLLIPSDHGVAIKESITGASVRTLASPQANAVAVTPDGNRIAALCPNQLFVWDLTQTPPARQSYRADAVGYWSTELDWVDETHLLAGDRGSGRVLFGLELKSPLWDYQFRKVKNEKGARLVEVVDGYLVYAVDLGSWGDKGYAVGAVKLPGPKVYETVEGVVLDDYMILKPDRAVKLVVKAGRHSEMAREELTKKILSNGWRISDDAPLVMTAEMKRGKSQTTKYQSMSSFGRGGDGEKSVTYTPYISSIVITGVDSENTIWQSSVSTHAPGHMFLKKGQTVGQRVKDQQKEDPEFFGRATIPAKIMNPAYRNGFGSTSVGVNGLIATPKEAKITLPPGVDIGVK